MGRTTGRLWLVLLPLWLQCNQVHADRFDEIYREALHILGGNANAVSKWLGPIRFRVVANSESSAIAKATMSEAAEIAGLTVIYQPTITSGAGTLLSTAQRNDPVPGLAV
ncbi:MAG: hypothetical protein ACR2PG_20250, partial [Hyphomicrobiaceae bacterium]